VEQVFAAIMTYVIWSMSQRVWQYTWSYFEHYGAHIYQIHLMYCGSPSDKWSRIITARCLVGGYLSPGGAVPPFFSKLNMRFYRG
jgi:hypothetical protein